jgi:hypothetical protein
MIPWWVGGGAVVMVLGFTFWAGDNYGWSAREYAKCKTATARRNAAISSANRTEIAKHAEEEAKRAADRKAFDKAARGIGQCLLTGDQAAALNGIGE